MCRRLFIDRIKQKISYGAGNLVRQWRWLGVFKTSLTGKKRSYLDSLDIILESSW